MRPHLTDGQLADLTMCFQMMDADGSGSIDADELADAFKVRGRRGDVWMHRME